MWRNLPDFRAEKKRRILSRLWLSFVFFGPENVSPPDLARHPPPPKSGKNVALKACQLSRDNLSKSSLPRGLPPVFQLLHPYSNFSGLIRIRHYITVTLQ